MRDKVLVKTERKLKKEGKNNKSTENEEDGFIRDKAGVISCCIPMVPCNKRGTPLPESLEDGGVKLSCTNNCAYSKHLVHPECFESLEQGLITMLSNQKTGKKGLIKAWLESQNEVNLWSKRGLEFIQKTVRCPCGKGQMYRDEDAWIKRQQLFDPLCDKKDKKFKLKANLPALTVAVKKGAAPPPGFHELDTHYLSSHSPPPSEKIDDKYGPPPPSEKIDDKYGPPPPETKARKPSIDDTVVPKPPAAKKIPVEVAFVKPSAPKPVEKPIKKTPIGYAPVKQEEFPKLVEEPSKLKEDIRPAPINNQWAKPKIVESNMANVAKPKSPELSQESLLNKWKQPPNIDQKARSETQQRKPDPVKPINVVPTNPPVMPRREDNNLEPRMQDLITMNAIVQPKIQRFMNDIEQLRNSNEFKERSAVRERATSPTNTTTSDTSSSSQNSYLYQRVSVGVQTEETSFPTYQYNPAPAWQRLDSVNYDSGNHSSVCSPSFGDSYRHPSNFNNFTVDDRLNGPRGFAYPSEIRKSSDTSSAFGNGYYEKEDISPKVTFLIKNRSFSVEVYHNGAKEKLKNSNGYTWTPMYLSMTEGGPHFGERAQNDYEDYKSFVIYDIMKVIGKPWNQIRLNEEWGFELSYENGTIGFDIDTPTIRRSFPQELVLAMFLKVMKLQADSHLGTAIKKIYISTDCYLTESQIKIFEAAADKLKLEIVNYALIDAY